MAGNPLDTYNKKRDFGITAEPKGKAGKNKKSGLRFVIQLHEATRTHYDFRLEWNGVMKSWAVTKGPSYDPADKRLAVRTEDHPMDYNDFEGVIPPRQYGAGPVMIWDEGVWIPDNDPDKMEKKGHIGFHIEGTRMHGHWNLVRLRTSEKRENWLLIKGKDDLIMTGKENEKFLPAQNVSAVSGRTMDEIRSAGLGKTVMRKQAALKKNAAVKAEPKKKTAKAKSQKSSGLSLSKLMDKFSTPELATLVENPPSGKDWIHEIKYDGYRLMGFISGGEVVLRTRGGKDWTEKFDTIAQALAKLKVENAVLDMEACVLDDHGRTSFSKLKEALSDAASENLEAYIFDLLYLDGEDVSHHPLIERKELLKTILKKVNGRIHFSEHFESSPDLLPNACQIGAEGIVSKRRNSSYIGRRTNDWVKSKCGLEQEFVIGGFMPAKDNAKAVGALLLGYYKNKKLTYAGKIGTGFTRKSAEDIYKKLIKLKREDQPFTEKLERGRRGYVFVDPKQLCEVSFFEWTPDGHIRHGSFKGLREDKNPKEVVEELPHKTEEVTGVKGIKGKSKPNAPVKLKPKTAKAAKSENIVVGDVTITHPDREVYPGTGITKGDMAEYYARVAPMMMPFLENRLISLLRCTNGIGGQCFFQRNPMKGMGDHIRPKKVKHNGKNYEYIYIDDETGLLQLAQMGTFEFHGWQGKVTDNGKADQIIFDLDPDDAVPFEAVKLAAEDVRRRLEARGLKSFPRLTGGKGIHIVAPVAPDHSMEDVKVFAREVAQKMQADMPDVYVATMTKKKRTGKIFVDFFRNDFSATAIVPFSLRAREGAPAAWPLSWKDLKAVRSANQYRLDKIKPADLKKAEKACAEYLKTRQKLKLT